MKLVRHFIARGVGQLCKRYAEQETETANSCRPTARYGILKDAKRHTDKRTDRHTDTYRHTGRETYRQVEEQIGGRNRRTNESHTWMDRMMQNLHMYRIMEMPIDRPQTERQ